jgi:hypothetical protein
MAVPKFLTLQELIRDHERLCAEVEELKKQFEGHVHGSAGGMVGVSTGGVQQPWVPGKCVDCGKELENPAGVICNDCIPF